MSYGARKNRTETSLDSCRHENFICDQDWMIGHWGKGLMNETSPVGYLFVNKNEIKSPTYATNKSKFQVDNEHT